MKQEELKIKIDNCNLCCNGYKKAQLYGNIDSKILFIAQNAGRYKVNINPDMIPFNLHDWTDKAKGNDTGDILKNMLFKIELFVDDFSITNLVKCFIDMNESHINNCRYWLNQEIRLMKNLSLIICLGKYSGNFFGLEEYGKVKELFLGLKFIMIWHPGYLLRNNNLISDYEKQFRIVKNEIEKL